MSSRPKRIQLSETVEFAREGFDGHVYPATADGTFNVLQVDVHGSHPRKRMLGDTTRNYYVVAGTGRFTIGDETFDVRPSDLYVITPQAEYQYEGEMTLLEFNVSPSGTIQDRLCDEHARN